MLEIIQVIVVLACVNGSLLPGRERGFHLPCIFLQVGHPVLDTVRRKDKKQSQTGWRSLLGPMIESLSPLVRLRDPDRNRPSAIGDRTAETLGLAWRICGLKLFCMILLYLENHCVVHSARWSV